MGKAKKMRVMAQVKKENKFKVIKEMIENAKTEQERKANEEFLAKVEQEYRTYKARG